MSNRLTFLINSLSKLPLAALRTFAGAIARILFSAARAKTLRSAQLNLKIAFPDYNEQQLMQLSKQATINEVTSYFEFLKIWGNPTEKNLSLIDKVHGEQHFHNALNSKNGVVLVVPHFGTWEIINPWLSQFTTLTIMYKPAKNPTADAFVKQARAREHAHLVPTDESGVRQVFRTLKQGGITAILPDHTPTHGGDLIQWFGVPLYSSQLTAKLIQKTQSTALLVYAIRNPNSGFDIYIEPLSTCIENSEHGTLLIHQTIEQLIQRHPAHYHWSYKRFKANPQTHNLYDIPEDEALNTIRKIQQTHQP